MGVALSVCTLPGQVTSDRLGPGKMELGLGIHGEPGAAVADIEPVDVVVLHVLKQILSPETHYVPISSGNRVFCMINGLGAAPIMEWMIAAGKAVPQLQLEHGLAFDRVYTGSFMTSLDMAGFSISIMKADESILQRMDSPTKAPYWPVGVDGRAEIIHLLKFLYLSHHLDQQKVKSYPLNDAAETINEIGASIRRSMGGTSGIIYNIFCKAAYAKLKESTSSIITPRQWIDAFEAAIGAVSKYGGALAGYWTLLDALIPASTALRKRLDAGDDPVTSFVHLSEAAFAGAEPTKHMQPQFLTLEQWLQQGGIKLRH